MKRNNGKNKNRIAALTAAVLMTAMLAGCGSPSSASQNSQTETMAASEVQAESSGSETETVSGQADAAETAEVTDVVEDWMVPVYADSLKDGSYPVTVDSSSPMFNIVDCTLTVADGKMTAVMTMKGTGYLYVYMGTGEAAAAAEESTYIAFEENPEGAHVYTVPVEALDSGINCAAFSKKKEKWYDRTLVFRADSLPAEAYADGFLTTAESLSLEDGNYTADVSLGGGSGRAGITSPAQLRVADGRVYATIEWSSNNYDYMLVDGEKYQPVTMEEFSTFEIPVNVFDRAFSVIADTTAMSEPHEVSYTLKFDASTVQKAE